MTAPPGPAGGGELDGPRATARRGRGPRRATPPLPAQPKDEHVVLVVEDDPAMATIMAHSLKARGYEVRHAATAEGALSSCTVEAPDLIVLDLGLPDMPGLELCRRIRSVSDVPIVVVTADGQESHKVTVLDAGADDYVTKPFSLPELHARLRAALRRSSRPEPEMGEAVLTVGSLHIRATEGFATLDGAALELTRKEFDLLTYLTRHAGTVLTHADLLGHVWGPFSTGRHEYLRTYMNLLRKKLSSGARAPAIVTRAGVGYMLVPPAAAGGGGGGGPTHRGSDPAPTA